MAKYRYIQEVEFKHDERRKMLVFLFLKSAYQAMLLNLEFDRSKWLLLGIEMIVILYKYKCYLA